MKLSTFILCFGLLTGSAIGQASPFASVGPPVLGFVPDSNRGLRPVMGIVGSAFIDAPVALGFDVVQTAIPATQDYVLATTNASEWPVLIQAKAGNVTVRSLASFLSLSDCSDLIVTSSYDRRITGCSRQEPSASGPARIRQFVLSPTGSAAAFLNDGDRSITSLLNLSQAPTVVARFALLPEGNVSALSVSDDGQSVLVGISDGSSGSLYQLNRNGAPSLLALMSHPSAIHFLRKSDQAIVSDDLDNKIYLVTSGQAVTVAVAENGISSPIAIETSNDNRKVFIGNAGSGSVTTMMLNENMFESMDCHCTLTGLYPTHMDSVFRLNDFDKGSIVLFDASTEPRFVLVPEGRY